MITEERYKQLMQDVGMPNSRSLLQALRQCAMEAALAEREECAKVCEELIAFDMDDPGQTAADAIRSR